MNRGKEKAGGGRTLGDIGEFSQRSVGHALTWPLYSQTCIRMARKEAQFMPDCR
jgi:hypothetical protein